MDAGDHEIEALQNVVFVVERPVRQDVGLDAFEDPEVLAEALVQAVGFPVLLRDLLNGETTGVVGGFGMVGYAEILEAPLARGLSHGLQRLGAVGSIGVGVKDTAQVLVGDELREFAFQSRLDLAASLPELGVDEGQTEGAIDLSRFAALRRRLHPRSGSPLI
jgi:hypothetical protein